MLPVWNILVVLSLFCSGLTSNGCGFNTMCSCSSGQHDTISKTIHSVACLSVPFYKFPNLPEGSINQLEVTGSNAVILEAEHLAGCQVQALVLSNNRLQHVAERAFSSQWKSLTSLDFSYNQLDSVPFVALKEMRSLQWINLHGNQISSLEGDWSHMKTTVATLFLGENDVTEIPPDHSSKSLHGLSQFKSLIWLNLDGNRIHRIHTQSLPTALQTVSISHNLIDSFPFETIASLPHLQWLYLRGNHIKTIPDHVFPKRLWMEKIDLGENFLKSLPSFPFNHSISIRDINLAHNDFRTLTAESFAGLGTRRIILSYNLLENLDVRAFQGIEDTLEYLDFDHNNFQHIPLAVSQLKSLKYLYLSSNALSEVPELAFDNFCSILKALSLSGNRLKRIPAEALINCTKLSHFNIAFNEIDEVHAEDFSGWGGNVRSLVLGNNRISQLTSRVFSKLVEVKELSLSFNPLLHIDGDAFSELEQLESLELSFCFDPDFVFHDCFAPLVHLQWLSLDNNNIEKLPEGLFESLGQLKYLNLESNKLRSLPSSLFKSLLELKDVRLSNNDLRYIETGTFRSFNSLESITLSGNKIKHIQKGSFEHLPSLRRLVLSHNRLVHVDHEAFSNLSSIGNVELQDNLLGSVSFKYFVHPLGPFVLNLTQSRISSCSSESSILPVEALDLSFNRLESVPKCLEHAPTLKRLFCDSNTITSLEHNAFMQLAMLEVLSLRSNNIAIVGRRAFFGLQHLQVLDLSHNFIGQLHTSQFVNMPKLRILNLRDNRLSYLPRDIFSNTLLEMLDLSLNSFAVVPTLSLSDVGVTLRHLSMRSNNIEHVDITTFPDVALLQHLDVSDNKLTILPDNVFTSLGLLLHLDLSFNPLQSNFKELFHYAQSLKRLDLSGAGLRSTPHFPLPNLVQLNLSRNHIDSISRSAVRQLGRLKLLDLSHNNLEQVPSHLWSCLPYLKVLDLSHNPLKELVGDSFTGLHNLQELTLLHLKYLNKFESDSLLQLRVLSKLTMETWPKLERFSDEFCRLLSHLDQLRVLSIHFSESKLDEQLLCVTNRKIRQLEIRGRRLRSVDRDAFVKFTRNPDLVLSIGGTQIEELPAGLFANMYKIAYLKIDFRGNALSHLSPEIFYGNSSGWRNAGTTLISGGLVIAGNPFRCGCHLAWLGHWLRRWTRESLHSHNAPVETAMRVNAMVKESTCMDATSGEAVPIVELPPEDSSCHASALSNTSSPKRGGCAVVVVVVVVLFLFDFVR